MQYINQASYDSENVLIVVGFFILILDKLFGETILGILTGYQVLSLMMGAILLGRTIRYWSLDKGDKYANN